VAWNPIQEWRYHQFESRKGKVFGTENKNVNRAVSIELLLFGTLFALLVHEMNIKTCRHNNMIHRRTRM
jgi:hypothetical protein